MTEKRIFACLYKIFIALLFTLPFVTFSSIYNHIKVGQELYLLFVIAFGLLLLSVTLFKTKEMYLKKLDFFVFIFIIYLCAHYYLCSFYGFFYNQFLLFIGYIVLFYLLKEIFKKETNKNLPAFSSLVFWLVALLEAAIAIAQQFGYFKSSNEFFKVVGTFINPNYLGISMLIGLLSSCYRWFYISEKTKTHQFILAFSAVIQLYVLYLSDSRAAYIGLLGGLFGFFITNKNNSTRIKAHPKKTIAFFGICCVSGFLFLLFLASLNQNSVDGRAFIRKISMQKIAENPFFGNGICNFTGIYNHAKATYFLSKDASWNEIKIGDYVAVAFNDYIQIIFEIGVIGFLLLGVLLFFVVKKISLTPITRWALSVFISFCLLAFFTSILYNPNVMIYLVWALALMIPTKFPKKEGVSIKNKSILKSFCVFLFCLASSLFFILFKKTEGLMKFKQANENVSQKIYHTLNPFDLLFIKDDAYLEFQLGYEEYVEGNEIKGLQLMENSVKKDPIPKANTALASLYIAQGKTAKAEEKFLYNIGIEPSRFEPLYNVLEFYTATNATEKKIKIAKRIITLPAKYPSAKVLEYKEIAKKILFSATKT